MSSDTTIQVAIWLGVLLLEVFILRVLNGTFLVFWINKTCFRVSWRVVPAVEADKFLDDNSRYMPAEAFLELVPNHRNQEIRNRLEYYQNVMKELLIRNRKHAVVVALEERHL